MRAPVKPALDFLTEAKSVGTLLLVVMANRRLMNQFDGEFSYFRFNEDGRG